MKNYMIYFIEKNALLTRMAELSFILLVVA